MVELALRASAILVVAWVVAALLKRATAATRHLVWHWAIIAVLSTPLLQPLVPTINVPDVPGAPAVPGVLRVPEVLRATELLGLPEGPKVSNVPTVLEVPGALNTSSTPGTPGTLGIVGTLVWCAGFFTTTLWFGLGWLSAALTARRATPVPASWHVEAGALRARMRITSDVQLRVVAANVSPLAMGFWRSTILLPSTAHGWDQDRRRAVLLHELAHIRRHDCRVHAFAQAACALHWFNPLVWLAFGRLRLERERACDDEVLQHGAQPSAYATHLLEIARGLRPALRPSAAIAMARASELEGRLLAVLAEGRARVPARTTRWAIAFALIATTVGALGVTFAETQRPPEQPPALVASRQPFKVLSLDAPTDAERVAARRARADASQALASAVDPQTRERAVLDLAASGQADTIPSLLAALDDVNQDVREKAALGLALQSSPDVIPGLIRALRDPDSQVREKAAMGLALRRDPRVVDALIPVMTDPDPQVREKTALALATSGDPRAVALLNRALQDPDAQVREKAVTGLMLVREGPSDLPQNDRVRDGLRGLVGALMGLTR